MIGYANEYIEGLPTFTEEEREKIKNFKIPGEEKDENVNFASIMAPRLRGHGAQILQYQREHKERLFWLCRAAGEDVGAWRGDY